MRLERSKEWWLENARAEGDAPVGAGPAALDARQHEDDTRIAFGRFVSLMRRQRNLSVEQLAGAAEIDPSELLDIEEDVHYIPDARTVFRLAQTFRVSQPRLMQVAGLTRVKDAGLRQEAVRFAARSEPLQKLSPEEAAALEAFVAVLSQDTQHTK